MTNRARLLSLLVLFALVLGLPRTTAVADEKPAKAAPKWEYTSLQMSVGATAKEMDKSFNDLGEQGWELATSNFTAFPNGGGVTNYVFKRAKR